MTFLIDQYSGKLLQAGFQREFHKNLLIQLKLSSLKLSVHICFHEHFQIWHSSQSIGNITNVSSFVLLQEQIFIEIMQLIILP